MGRNIGLRDDPYVVVRIACRDCPRIGRYLAVLAERFGADCLMVDVLGVISSTCLPPMPWSPHRARCERVIGSC